MKTNVKLIDRIEYYMEHPKDEEYFHSMFTAEEKNILYAIRTYEQNRYMMKLKELTGSDKERAAKEIIRARREDKEICLRLKRQMEVQINCLLAQKKAEAWMEILTWYQVLDGKGIITGRFWEFPVLRTMLDAFVEELKLYYSNGIPISLLSICSMEGLTEIYFRIVFLLRRIEYDVDPVGEILHELEEMGISGTAVNIILRDARIFHREKVEKTLESWE